MPAEEIAVPAIYKDRWVTDTEYCDFLSGYINIRWLNISPELFLLKK